MIFSELIQDLQKELRVNLAQIRFLLKKNPGMGYTRIVEIGKEVGKKYNIKLVVNFPRAVAQFEDAMQKFPVKKILYKNIFRGKGLEFDSYRTFEPDDDSSLIDWKASLRAKQILAKRYIEERKLNVYFLVDVTSQSALTMPVHQTVCMESTGMSCVLQHVAVSG